MNSVKFHFIMPVWGAEHIEQFLKITLPCQVSEGNLGCFTNRDRGDKYEIYTTSKDAQQIKQSKVFAELNRLIETEIHTIDDTREAFARKKITKYDLMSVCHGRGIESAKKENACFVALCADMIFSDGSFAHLLKIALSGKRLIAMGSFRVVKESMTPELVKYFYPQKGGRITITGRELVKLSLEHIHHDSQILFVENETYANGWPAYLFWDVDGTGILKRGFHLHPIVMNPTRRDEMPFLQPGATIDGYDYMVRAVPDFSDVHVIDDSDDFTCVSLHPASSCEPPPPHKFNALQVAAWIKKNCCQYHVNFVETPIRFHSTEITPQWKKNERVSDKVVKSILDYRKFLEAHPDVYEAMETLRVYIHQNPVRPLISTIHTLKNENAELKRNATIAYINLGSELKNQGKNDKAVAALKEAVKVSPGDPNLYNQIGIIFFQLNEFTAAEKMFQAALNISPKDVDAHLNLGRLYITRGQYSAAAKYLTDATRLAPDDAEIFATIGELGVRLGDIQTMQTALDQLKKIDPRHPMIQTLHN